jgi:lysophospholipase L1-like esterase
MQTMKKSSAFILYSLLIPACLAVIFIACNPYVSPQSAACLLPMADTTVSINDTITLYVLPCNPHAHARAYVWSFDNGETWKISDSNIFYKSWGASDTGRNIVLVQMVTSERSLSPIDTITVTVVLNAPSVSILTADTSIFIGDTMVVHARAVDSNGTATQYVWLGRLISYRNATTSCSLLVMPTMADTGKNIIRVRAVDDDSISSDYDTIVITVKKGEPWIAPIADTTLSSLDTLRICAHAGDSNGAIQAYYWDYSGGPWDTATADSCYRIAYQNVDSVRVRIAAADDQGLMDTVAFTLKYDRPPAMPSFSSPLSPVIYSPRDSSHAKGEIRFAFKSSDPDGPDDSLRYSLYLGADKQALQLAYSGRDTLFDTAGIDTGTYYRTLVARDVFGNTTALEDSFACMLQRDICFTGHSIVEGVCSESGKGGFRKMVLDTLRATFSPHQLFNCVGPVSSGNIDNSEDDSSLAVSGIASWTLLDSLILHPDLSADIWVLMIGVNGNYYGYWERYYTPQLIDSIYERNHAAYIYVLNGLALPDTMSTYIHARTDYFNESLDILEDQYRAQGRNLRVVNAFEAMTIDSSFNAGLFCDELHPNPAGYKALADAIIKTMRQDW